MQLYFALNFGHIVPVIVPSEWLSAYLDINLCGCTHVFLSLEATSHKLHIFNEYKGHGPPVFSQIYVYAEAACHLCGCAHVFLSREATSYKLHIFNE